MIVLNDKTAEGAIRLDAELERIYEETRSSVCAYLLYLGVPADQAQEVYARSIPAPPQNHAAGHAK